MSISKYNIYTSVKNITDEFELILKSISSLDDKESIHNKSSFVRTIQFKLSIVKPAHAVTSIKQSPVLKGHLFLVKINKISYKYLN